jgi:hypothetical protein
LTPARSDPTSPWLEPQPQTGEVRDHPKASIRLLTDDAIPPHKRKIARKLLAVLDSEPLQDGISYLGSTFITLVLTKAKQEDGKVKAATIKRCIDLLRDTVMEGFVFSATTSRSASTRSTRHLTVVRPHDHHSRSHPPPHVPGAAHRPSAASAGYPSVASPRPRRADHFAAPENSE